MRYGLFHRLDSSWLAFSNWQRRTFSIVVVWPKRELFKVNEVFSQDGIKQKKWIVKRENVIFVINIMFIESNCKALKAARTRRSACEKVTFNSPRQLASFVTQTCTRTSSMEILIWIIGLSSFCLARFQTEGQPNTNLSLNRKTRNRTTL